MAQLLSVVLTLVLIPFYFFFFAWRLDRMREVVRFVPASHREETLKILRRMDHAVGGFFRARVAISLATGVLFAIGWWVTGLPYWFLRRARSLKTPDGNGPRARRNGPERRPFSTNDRSISPAVGTFFSAPRETVA